MFGASADLVNVTVTVVDRRGRPVHDLTRDDFAVFEDGRPQPIALFGRAHEPGQDELLGLDLALLMDTSESMLAELRLSQEAAVRFLEAIPRAHDLLTIFFDADIQVSRFDSENQQGLIERIHAAKGGGSTALYDALAICLARVQDSTGRKVIVLFTDGDDTISTTSRSDVMRLVRSSGVTIYPIAFRGEYGPSHTKTLLAQAFLRELGAVTGGEVFSPHASKDLPAIYSRILEQLSAQYVVGFSSDAPGRDGRYRRLKVEVRRPELKVRHREGYFAAPAGAAASEAR